MPTKFKSKSKRSGKSDRALRRSKRNRQRSSQNAAPNPSRVEMLEARMLMSGDHLHELDWLPVPDATQMYEAAVIEGTSETAATVPLNDTFTLQSREGAAHTIYLDFDGHVTSNTYWNNGRGDFETQAYDFDGNVNSFSDAELQRIQNIWQRVAEDFSPFDVNVTTMDPGTDALTKTGGGDQEWGTRVVIGGSSYDWFGQGAGGVAYLNSFNWSTDTPAFVFEDQLGNGNEKFVAEAVSHEAGHALGLGHDGTSSTGYYRGHGSGDTGWAPIMGVGYSKNLTQWSKGEYNDANNGQDDLSRILSNGFGYRPDDHGDSNSTATLLTPSNGTIVGSGIIEQSNDFDAFSFITGGGYVSLDILPFERGPNLDVFASLYRGDGSLVASSNPTNSLAANIDVSLSAGTYYLHVSGEGKGDLSTGYSDYASLGQYTIHGEVNDAGPAISVNDVVVNESDGTATFTVSMSQASNQTVTVNATTSAGSASGSDFGGQSQTLSFVAGQTSQTFTVSIDSDLLVESNESFFVNLSNATGGATIDDEQGSGTIVDDDFMVNMMISDAVVNETTGMAVFTVSLSEANNHAITVDVSTDNNSATEGDFSGRTSTLTFGVGETTKTFEVAIHDDMTVEGTENFLVNLSNATGNVTIVDGGGVGTIMDDDVMSNVAISDVVVNEDAGTATFTISLSQANNHAISIDVSTSQGTANGLDFGNITRTVNFAAGETRKTVQVAIHDDATFEGDETFTVNLSNPTGNATITDGQGVGTIIDNELMSNVVISDAVINEDAGVAVFTVSLSQANNHPITVDVTTSLGTATGQDFADTTQTLTFAAGETTKTVEVAIHDDALLEGNETFFVDLSNVNGNASIEDGHGVGTIIDNEVAVMVSVSDAEVNEDAGVAVFTVSLSRASNQPVTVQVTTMAGSASDDDFSLLSETVTFAVGETTKTVEVAINDDDAVESSETFTANLSNATGNAAIERGQGTGTIIDNDIAVNVSISDATIDEDTGIAVFTVTLSQASNRTVTVDVETAADSAASDDFDSLSRTLTFEAGETSKTFEVAITDDQIVEDNETFHAVLSNATGNATITDGQGVGTIMDNDTAVDSSKPTVSVSDAIAAETNPRKWRKNPLRTTTMQFTVTLSAPSDKAVTVDYTTIGGTATAGVDFFANNGVLTFEAGETTKVINVKIIGDYVNEQHETLNLVLNDAVGATISDGEGKGTIIDNDGSRYKRLLARRVHRQIRHIQRHTASPETMGSMLSDQAVAIDQLLQNNQFNFRNVRKAWRNR